MLTNEMYESFLDKEKDSEQKDATRHCAGEVVSDATDEAISDQEVRSSIFPCLTDEEAKRALETLLHTPKVHVKVVGGILRHDFT